MILSTNIYDCNVGTVRAEQKHPNAYIQACIVKLDHKRPLLHFVCQDQRFCDCRCWVFSLCQMVLQRKRKFFVLSNIILNI